MTFQKHTVRFGAHAPVRRKQDKERFVYAYSKSIGEKRAKEGHEENKIPCSHFMSAAPWRLHEGVYNDA